MKANAGGATTKKLNFLKDLAAVGDRKLALIRDFATLHAEGALEDRIKTVGQIAREDEVHPVQVTQWGLSRSGGL